MNNPLHNSIYKRNKPKLFTETSKNLNQLKNNDRIENILDSAKIIKSKQQPKKFKCFLIIIMSRW